MISSLCLLITVHVDKYFKSGPDDKEKPWTEDQKKSKQDRLKNGERKKSRRVPWDDLTQV